MISVGGKWLGKSIALAGHTDDMTIHEIVIGNNVISAPANAIRFERDRTDRVVDRLDLYLHWPDMRGYSEAMRNDFNNLNGVKRIMFVSFEARMMSRDMSGRFEPIYRSLIDTPGTSGPAGLTYFNFSKKSGYMNELLAVAARPGKDPFVARCLSGQALKNRLRLASATSTSAMTSACPTGSRRSCLSTGRRSIRPSWARRSER